VIVALGIALLLLGAAAALVPLRFRWLLRLAGSLGLALGLAGWAFLFLGPKDYLVRWPFLAAGFHPILVGLYSAVALLLGTGVWLGLALRALIRAPGDGHPP